MTIYEGTEQDKMNEVFDKGEDALKNGQSAAGLGSKISGLMGNSGAASSLGGVAGGLSIATTALGHIQDFVNNINVEKPEFKADNIKNATSYQGLENMSQMKMPNYMQADTKDFGEMAFHALKQSGEGVISAYSTGLIGMIISGIMGGGIANVGDYLHNKRAREAADQYNWQVNNYQKDWAKAMNESKKNIENEMSFDMHRNTVHFAAGGGALDAGNGVTEFTTGGSHESNPYGGIQQGIASDGMPNYVEEGEVKWDKENYIFPTRMKPTKKLLKDFVLKEKWHGKNYAEIAKIIQKTSEERENDPVARQTVDDMLGRLMQCHQEQKMQEEVKQMLKMIEAMPPEERAAFMQQMAGAAQNMYGAPQQQMPQVMPPQGMEQGMPIGEPQGMGMGYAPMQEEAAMSYEGEGVPMGIAACGGKLSHKFDKGGGANIVARGSINRNMPIRGYRESVMAEPVEPLKRYVRPDGTVDPVVISDLISSGNWKNSPESQAALFDYFSSMYGSNPAPWLMRSTNYQNPYLDGLVDRKGVDSSMPATREELIEAVVEAERNPNINIPVIEYAAENPTSMVEEDPRLAALKVLGYDPSAKTRGFQWAGTRNKTTWKGATDRNAWKNKEFVESLKQNPALDGYVGPWGYDNQREMAEYMYNSPAWKARQVYLNEPGKEYERRKEYIEEHINDPGLENAMKKMEFLTRDKDRKIIWNDEKKDEFINYFNDKSEDKLIGAMYDTGSPTATDVEAYYIDENGNAQKLDTTDGYTAIGDPYEFYHEGSGKNKKVSFYSKNVPPQTPEKPKDEKKPAEEEQKVTSENEQTPYPKYNPWPGFAKAGIALAGAFNRPDYEKANILQGWRPQPMDYEPIGDYQRFNPVDVNYLANQIGAQQNRMYDIMGNTTSPSRAAALLAQQYAGRNAAGDAYFQALEANRNEENRVRDFNRGTNQFNAQAANEAARVNFGLNEYGWGQTKAYADARDAASTLASTANSKAISSFGNNMGEAYKDWYNTKALEWMLKNKVFPSVTTSTSES